uniref:Uncharacterized protein n=1 Tax=Podarcis muralis TaxID=64176 RepID=A0A670JEA1_PODMU
MYPTLRAVMFWIALFKPLSIWSTFCATSLVSLSRSLITCGSMGGISAVLPLTDNCDDTDEEEVGSVSSRLPRELILIFICRLLATKCVRSPSWLTVPSSSKALDMVALLPS